MGTHKKKASDLKIAASAITGAGAALLAAATSACCIPVVVQPVVSVLGVSGAVWAAGFKPYSPYILLAAGVLLGFGFWSVYRPPPSEGEGAVCSSKRPVVVLIGLWSSAFLWLGALALNILQSVVHRL